MRSGSRCSPSVRPIRPSLRRTPQVNDAALAEAGRCPVHPLPTGRALAPTSRQTSPAIIAVLGATGRVGRTTVAALLTRALGDRGRRAAVLAVDLDGSSPGLHAALSGRSRSDLAANDGELQVEDDALSGVDILAAGERTGESEEAPSVSSVAGLIADVASRYAAVVIDTPADVTWPAAATLRLATAIVVVATPSSDGVTSAVVAARRIARVATGRPVWVVVNRATPSAARATFAMIEDCHSALAGGETIELRFLCAVTADAGLARALSRPLLGAAPWIDTWNLAAARRAAGMLTSEVTS